MRFAIVISTVSAARKLLLSRVRQAATRLSSGMKAACVRIRAAFAVKYISQSTLIHPSARSRISSEHRIQSENSLTTKNFPNRPSPATLNKAVTSYVEMAVAKPFHSSARPRGTATRARWIATLGLLNKANHNRFRSQFPTNASLSQLYNPSSRNQPHRNNSSTIRPSNGDRLQFPRAIHWWPWRPRRSTSTWRTEYLQHARRRAGNGIEVPAET
jgi:hypothetical protein